MHSLMFTESGSIQYLIYECLCKHYININCIRNIRTLSDLKFRYIHESFVPPFISIFVNIAIVLTFV